MKPVKDSGRRENVGGGMVRDVVLRRIPAIFGGNTLYAIPAVVASAVMVLCYDNGLRVAGPAIATLVGAGFTLLARWRRWQLPAAPAWEGGGLPRYPRPRWRRENREAAPPASADDETDRRSS